MSVTRNSLVVGVLTAALSLAGCDTDQQAALPVAAQNYISACEAGGLTASFVHYQASGGYWYTRVSCTKQAEFEGPKL